MKIKGTLPEEVGLFMTTATCDKIMLKTLDDVEDIDYRWYGREILWLCSNPTYGESQPEIRKKLKIPKHITDEALRKMLNFFKEQDWLRLKLDDDDGYYWTTNKGIVAYRQIHALHRVDMGIATLPEDAIISIIRKHPGITYDELIYETLESPSRLWSTLYRLQKLKLVKTTNIPGKKAKGWILS